MNDQNVKKCPERVFVDLWANESILKRRQLVVEIPPDCDRAELTGLSGDTLDQWADAAGLDPEWDYEDCVDFDVQDEITVESGVPEHLGSDLILVRDNDGRLVLREEE